MEPSKESTFPNIETLRKKFKEDQEKKIAAVKKRAEEEKKRLEEEAEEETKRLEEEEFDPEKYVQKQKEQEEAKCSSEGKSKPFYVLFFVFYLPYIYLAFSF